jgi:Uma2 family endonuclease
MVQQLTKPTIDFSEGSTLEMSYEEYVQWCDEGNIGEWVDGKVIEFMTASERHQDIVIFLIQVLGLFVRKRKLGKISAAPFSMRLFGGNSYRMPDVIFVSTANLARFVGKRLDGPADLAIEVVSPESVTRDRREKFAEYALNGVSEYWIVDPTPGRQLVRGFTLSEERYYEDMVPDAEGSLHSVAVPGFILRPSWFGEDQELDPEAALAELGVGV